MEETQIDLIPIKDLWAEYGVGKTTFYTRALADLRIAPKTVGNRSYITGQEKSLLDKYYSLLESNRSSWLDELFGRTEQEEISDLVQSDRPLPTEFTLHLPEVAEVKELLQEFLNQKDHTVPYKQLLYFAENKIRIPSSLVRELTERQPRGEQFLWGSFVFVRVLPWQSETDRGRIGRELSWYVRVRP